MRRLARCVLAVVLLLSVAPAAVGAADVQNRYEIVVTLLPEERALDVDLRTTFVNRSEVALGTAEFSLPPGARERVSGLEARVDGAGAAHQRDGSLLVVRTPSVPPGQAATVWLRYRVAIPEGSSLRLGHADGIFALGYWQAVLFPLDRSGWRRARYIDIGDALTAEASSVRLTVRAPADLVVAVPGRVEVSRPGEITTRLNRARDIAFAASRRFVRASDSAAGTQFIAWSVLEDGAVGREYLRVATGFAAWLHDRLAIAPEGPVHLVSVGAPGRVQSGQEFSGVLFLGRGLSGPGTGPGTYFDYLVAHEVAHQWFYDLVGNDQVREPWLDEALATYLAELYTRERHPAIGAARWEALRRRDATELGNRFVPIDQGIAQFARDESPYFAVVYRRGALYLEEVRQEVGDSAFWAALRTYVHEQQGALSTGEALNARFDQVAARPLDQIRARYFASPRPPPGETAVRTRSFSEAGVFRVTDDGQARFLSAFERHGGVTELGYPISRRFHLDGFLVQAFQKAILQWRPESGTAAFLNVLDRLTESGRDDWLLVHRMTPRPFDGAADHGLTWDAIVARRLRYLDVDTRLRARYNAVANPIEIYGLPTAVAEYAEATVVRCQRAVFQLWKVDTPWARAGEVTIANGGDLARESGLIPADALTPELP